VGMKSERWRHSFLGARGTGTRMRRKNEMKGGTRRVGPRQAILDAAEFYVRARFRAWEPVRPQEFADSLGVSRSHLSRRVKKLFGVCLVDVLRERQLAEAVRLLTTTPLSVERVGAASGFGAEWTFYRCFKAAFGQTPAAYRRRFSGYSLWIDSISSSRRGSSGASSTT
jgi:AraC-like DNA-binding protein